LSALQDKLRSLIRKWHTLIEAIVDAKTTDGYYLRVFCIGFTKKRMNQRAKKCHAQSSQIREIRAKMVEVIKEEVRAGGCRVPFCGKRLHHTHTHTHARACMGSTSDM